MRDYEFFGWLYEPLVSKRVSTTPLLFHNWKPLGTILWIYFHCTVLGTTWPQGKHLPEKYGNIHYALPGSCSNKQQYSLFRMAPCLSSPLSSWETGLLTPTPCATSGSSKNAFLAYRFSSAKFVCYFVIPFLQGSLMLLLPLAKLQCVLSYPLFWVLRFLGLYDSMTVHYQISVNSPSPTLQRHSCCLNPKSETQTYTLLTAIFISSCWIDPLTIVSFHLRSILSDEYSYSCWL